MTKAVIALGFFDGVHVGHAALLRRTAILAAEMCAVPAALLFEQMPNMPPLILSPEQRLARIKSHDIQKMIHIPSALLSMAAADFPRYLQHEHGAVGLVAGHDFRYGHGGLGNIAMLREQCQAHGILLDIVDCVQVEGKVVSSTRIRQLLADGNVAEASVLLGYDYGNLTADHSKCG